MNPITQSQLRRGRTNQATGKEITKQAVSKAVSSGKLTTCDVSGKSMIDLDGHLTVEWIRSHPIQAAKPAQPQTAPQTAPTIPDPPPQKQQTPASAYLPQAGNNPSGTAGHTGDDEETNLKDENLDLKNEKLRIENSQKRGDLVLKPLTGSIFKMIYGIHENQFKSIAVKSKPKIEAAYTALYPAKADEILEALGLKPDKNQKTEILKILNIGESDRARVITEIMEDETGAILKNIQHEIDRGMKLMEV